MAKKFKKPIPRKQPIDWVNDVDWEGADPFAPFKPTTRKVVKPKTSPLKARQDYEKAYGEYAKKVRQAKGEKVAKNVKKYTSDFANDYLTPATITAASLLMGPEIATGYYGPVLKSMANTAKLFKEGSDVAAAAGIADIFGASALPVLSHTAGYYASKKVKEHHANKSVPISNMLPEVTVTPNNNSGLTLPTQKFGGGGNALGLEEDQLAQVTNADAMTDNTGGNTISQIGQSAGPVGGFVMGMVGTAANVLAAAKAKRTAKYNSEVLEKANRFSNDSAVLDNFDRDGTNTSFYNKGGFKLNARNFGNFKNFKAIDGNIVEIMGRRHEQGGTPIGNGKEAEKGEVAKVTPTGMKILSDRPEYFGFSPADEAKKNPAIFDELYAIQEGIKGKPTIGNKADLGANWVIPEMALMFQNAVVDKTLHDKFNGINNPTKPSTNKFTLAESIKTSPTYANAMGSKIKGVGADDYFNSRYNPYTTAKETGNWSNIWNNTKPDMTKTGKERNTTEGYKINPANYFMDNLTNFITTAATPNPIPPALIPHVNLNTDVDVENEVTNVKNTERGIVERLRTGISDANVRNALMISAGNTATNQINDIRSKERNEENVLKNQESLANLNVNNENTDRINYFRDAVVQKNLAVLESINQNAANLSNDLVDMEDKKNLYNKDLERLNIELSKDHMDVLSEVLKTGALDKYIIDGKFNYSNLTPKDRLEVKKILDKYTQKNG